MSVRIACVQCDVVYGDPSSNAATAVMRLRELRSRGVDLAVFPEAFLTGYCYESQDVALAKAIEIEYDSQFRVRNPKSPVRAIMEACQEVGIHAVVGTVSTDGAVLQNAALLFLPDGTVYRYFKTHLPYLGVDRFVVPGWDLPVFETDLGRIGMLVCYDVRVPEACRVLALAGADLVVLPTNWPEGAELSPAHVAPTRALENRVFLATCNRIGIEGGVKFIGRSGIYDVLGRTLVEAGDAEEVIVADVDLADAREKRTVVRPGEYELDVMGSRRPRLYEGLCK
jgi:predicted amidohydrolase